MKRVDPLSTRFRLLLLFFLKEPNSFYVMSTFNVETLWVLFAKLKIGRTIIYKDRMFKEIIPKLKSLEIYDIRHA